MEQLAQQILGLDRVDLEKAAQRLQNAIPELQESLRLPYRRGRLTLLEHAQRAADAFLTSRPWPAPEAAPPRWMRPWCDRRPAAYAACLFHDIGRLAHETPAGQEEAIEDGHSRSGASMARTIMFKLGLPFEVREPAVSLIMHHTAAERFQSRQVRDEQVLALACEIDLRSLYLMRRANYAQMAGEWVSGRLAMLERFRERCEALGVFGQLPVPPLSAADLDGLGVGDDDLRLWLANAARYFRVAERLTDPSWHRQRARETLGGPRGTLEILVGVSGSGKSAWIEQHAAGREIVSTDQLREMLTGNAGSQHMNTVVFERCMERVRRLLGEGRTAVFDATNVSVSARAMPVRTARWHGARIVALFFDTPLWIALDRNRGRPRQVPEEVLLRQFAALTVPRLYECDELNVVSPDGSCRHVWP